MQSFRSLLKPLTAVLLLHMGFASYRLLPALENFNPLMFLLPMGELILIFVLLGDSKFRKTGTVIAFVLLSFLFFFLTGELFYRIFYLEHFDIISDMQLIPNLFVMLLHGTNLPAGFIKVAAVIFSISVTMLFALGLLAIIRKSANSMRALISKKVKIILSSAAVLFMLIAPANSPVSQTVSMMVGSHVPDSREIQDVPEMGAEELPETELQTQESEWIYPGIEDSDIHFVVIESYGAVLFQKENYRDIMRGTYDELQMLLKDEGLVVKSGFVRSPAFGGRSWLADATLISGVQIANQKIYDKRIRNGETAYLLAEMKQAGYVSYYVAPGSTQASTEWKDAYPFDTYLLQDDFGYQGPNLSFGVMSDQYMFNEFAENHLRDDQKEFAFYLLVSSHTPFVRIPVYKEDWDFSQKGREYENGSLKYFENNWLYGNELAEGYLEGIRYSLTTTIHYLTDILSGRKFMLIIGDHQPRRPVSGPNAGYPVIFHIIFPAGSNITFQEGWSLSSSLIPPRLPADYNDLPEMAAIPYLIEQLIK